MTVLIPFIGYLVIFNENLQSYLQLSRYIFGAEEHLQGIATEAHVSWRLLFIYFALCCLGIGSIVYQFACSDTIKQFGSSIDYIGATRSHMGDVMLGRLESRLKSDRLSSDEFDQLQSLARERAETARSRVMPRVSRENFLAALPPQAEAAGARVYDQYWRDLLDLNFRTDDQRHLLARLATFLLYAVGFTLLSVPSIDVFWRVTVVALRTLLS